MKESILKSKSFDFAISIVNIYKYLVEEKKEYVMSKQILRCGTSIGANISEGVYSESKFDFIHKYAIAQKEENETKYWLELLMKTNYLTEEQYKTLNNSLVELLKMTTASIKTAKQSLITNH